MTCTPRDRVTGHTYKGVTRSGPDDPVTLRGWSAIDAQRLRLLARLVAAVEEAQAAEDQATLAILDEAVASLRRLTRLEVPGGAEN